MSWSDIAKPNKKGTPLPKKSGQSSSSQGKQKASLAPTQGSLSTAIPVRSSVNPQKEFTKIAFHECFNKIKSISAPEIRNLKAPPILTAPPDLSKTARRRFNQKERKKQEEYQKQATEAAAAPKIEIRTVRGLHNAGNTCFLNSTLQVLFACHPFYQLIKYLCDFSFPIPVPLLTSFIEYIIHYEEEGQNSAYNPVEFIRILHRFNPYTLQAHQRQQEDAQEYLNWILNRLHTEFVRLAEHFGEDPSQLSQTTPLDPLIDDDSWEEVGEKNKINQIHTVKVTHSPISELFRSQLRNMLQKQGTKNAAHIQPYYCLPLEITSGSITSLESAITRFLSTEYLGNATAGKVTSAKLSFEQLPPILTLQLARFRYENDGSIQKIQKAISYPSILQLNKNCLSSKLLGTSPPLRYALFAIITHHGDTIHSGHYTCNMKTQQSTWLHCNDGQVTKEEESHIGTQQTNVYLLHYQKIE